MFPDFLADDYFRLVPAEKVHCLFLRWHTGAFKGVHRRVLCQAGGGLPLGAHWLRRAAAFWTRLGRAEPTSLVHRAFRDDLSLLGEGGDCWSARLLPTLVRFGAVPLFPPSPLWAVPASLSAAQLLQHNAALWEDASCLCPSPRDVSAVHLRGRTFYTFAAWFRYVTAGLPVHHRVPDWAWREVLEFCTGGWFLCGTTTRWHQGPATAGCPCCGRPPEDELHVMLECTAYSDLRAVHGALFAGLPANPQSAMCGLFCAGHFRPLARFLKACRARRSACVSGRVPPIGSVAIPLPAMLSISAGVSARFSLCLLLCGCVLASIFVMCAFWGLP